jgi:putative PIG3 family NAD(P)H quinone oxidoreductase
MTTTMRAAIITRPGGPEVLEVRDVARPSPGVEQVLVRVRASALNRADIAQRLGRYPAPPGSPSDIPGMEFAGEIAECGPHTQLWREGDRVFGIIGGGGNAEYVVVHERMLARVPENLSWHEAAAIPEVFITAHDAMFTQAGVRPSERVLIHAVGSGVGLAAVQLARVVNAIPFGTARSPEKIDRAREYGLAEGFAVSGDPSSIVEPVQRATPGNAGVEVVLDLVGGDYLAASIRTAALRGRIILISTMGGANTQLPLGQILGKRLTIRGTVLRARPLEEKIEATRRFAADVVPLFASKAVRPVIDRVFPLAAIADAHTRLESNATFGKVVIDVAS